MLLLAAMLRLAALRWLGVCVILLTPLSAANLASAHELVQTKTRVGGFESAAPLHIWLNGSATERSYSGNLRCEPEVASESLLAARGVARPTVTNSKLGNLVNDLYKGARTKSPIGTGSTADAIRHEAATGQAVGGKFHTQKGQEYSRALESWLGKNPNAAAGDRSAAQSMLDDLRNALGGK